MQADKINGSQKKQLKWYSEKKQCIEVEWKQTFWFLSFCFSTGLWTQERNDEPPSQINKANVCLFIH